MSKYQILQFTPDRLKEVSAHWRSSIADEDAFVLECEGLFQWCASHIDHCEGDSQAWELRNQESGVCDAIVELVNSRKGTMQKLLKLFVSPRYWDAETERPNIVDLYVNAFVLVISKGVIGGAKDVKLYGRNDLMMSILRSVHAHWSVSGTKAEFQGRFLTISMIS